MTTVKQLLDEKGHEVWTVHPDESVLDAIRKMADKNIGSVVVVEDGKPVGIFTERHYARHVFLKGKSSPKTTIREVMETRVAYARPDQTVDECMCVMSENRVRHLPVLHGDELIGIISIGDLVKSTISDQQFTIEQLEHYIHHG